MAIPSLRPEIKRILILAFWVVFSLGYFNRFPLPGFFSKLFLVSLAAIVSLSAWGYGSLWFPARLVAQLTFLEASILRTLCGFGSLSLLMAAAGLFGAWTRNGALALTGAGLLLAAWQKGAYPPVAIRRPAVMGLRLCLIIAGAFLSFLLAFAPVTYYDSLVYHLALPQAYVQAGHWISQRDLIYSAFPQVMEMLWTLGLLLSNDILANLLGWIISLMGIVGVYAYGKRFLSQSTGLWAATLLGVMPAYMLLSTGGYVDVGLAVFSFFSFYALCLKTEKRFCALAGFFGRVRLRS